MNVLGFPPYPVYSLNCFHTQTNFPETATARAWQKNYPMAKRSDKPRF